MGMRGNQVYAILNRRINDAVAGEGTLQTQVIESVITSKTATDSEVEGMVNEIFGSEQESPGDSTEEVTNTATDEEVEDILNDVFGEKP